MVWKSKFGYCLACLILYIFWSASCNAASRPCEGFLLATPIDALIFAATSAFWIRSNNALPLAESHSTLIIPNSSPPSLATTSCVWSTNTESRTFAGRSLQSIESIALSCQQWPGLSLPCRSSFTIEYPKSANCFTHGKCLSAMASLWWTTTKLDERAITAYRRHPVAIKGCLRNCQ